MEQLCSYWTDFHEIWYLSIFRKCDEKIQFSLKSGKNNGYVTWRPVYMCDNIAQLFLELEMFQGNVEKIKTYFVFRDIFQKSCRLWDNVEKYGRAG